MTEEEAKHTRCCGPEGCGEMRYDGSPLDQKRHCIGSACMAWRWDVEKNRKGPGIDHGYCGLAGKP